MIEADKAVFNLVKFTVPKFAYNKSGHEQTPPLKLEFNPSGVYYPKLGRFDLKIEFSGFMKGAKRSPIIKMTTIAEFKFTVNTSLEDFPAYFYPNSIAIVFPYLRAFISTLTMQSNTGVIMLGLINFTSMAEPLRNNIIVR